MREDEFLNLLERRLAEAIRSRADNARWAYCGDGFVINGLPLTYKTPVTGVAWTLGGRTDRNNLEIWLTAKAHALWRQAEFERLLPPPKESDWFHYDPEQATVTIRLRVH